VPVLRVSWCAPHPTITRPNPRSRPVLSPVKFRSSNEERPATDTLRQTHVLDQSTCGERAVDTECPLPSTIELSRRPLPRRTPRVSLIVVLPESSVVSPDRLAESLRSHGKQDIDIVVACAGQPTNLSALQKSVGDAQFLLAPAGTSTEDLRELAMRQAPGDIVTLLSGALLPASNVEGSLVMTS
jgi:hypothetical protein